MEHGPAISAGDHERPFISSEELTSRPSIRGIRCDLKFSLDGRHHLRSIGPYHLLGLVIRSPHTFCLRGSYV